MIEFSDKAELFNFKVNGKKYSIPKAKCMPYSMVKKWRGLSNIEDEEEKNNKALEMQEKIFNKYCPKLLEDVTIGTFEKIISAWYEDSGITMGES